MIKANRLNEMPQFLKPFALKLTQNDQDANDLIQDTMMKALRNLDKFKEGTNLKAWLYTIMKNTFITHTQKASRKNTFLDTTDNMHYLNTSGTLVQNQAYSGFVMDDIRKAIESLDEQFKKPFVMHYRGFKYTEIATRLQLPLGTVKNRIHLARKELKEHLEVYAPQ